MGVVKASLWEKTTAHWPLSWVSYAFNREDDTEAILAGDGSHVRTTPSAVCVVSVCPVIEART